MSRNEAAAVSGNRKWHSKSRTGCQSCKTRKIKCDEERPSCRNCLKRSLQCGFLQRVDHPHPAQAPVNLQLELLHHYTVSTCYTLASDPQVRDVFRVLVPQMGFETDYILNGILALSAIHLARFNPSRHDDLIEHATEYHAVSLSKGLPLVSNITPQNCSSLFIFALLTLFYNLARPRGSDTMLILENGVVPEWLYLLRGIDGLRRAEETLMNSPVWIIAHETQRSEDFWLEHSPQPNKPLDELEARIRKDLSDEQHAPTVLILIDAISKLRRSYTFRDDPNFKNDDKMRGLYQWLFEMGDDYLWLLKGGNNEALCVLAYFVVLVRELEKCWWMEGWAIHLIRRIHSVVNDKYRIWIRWPMEEIGWVPETPMRQTVGDL
ncbi:hypothetical protein N7478_002057 [Penicillium angulare]|uniref:uncharacterized protein n=1 Tax=Penicillium angulare TaxID=116970 RepID=UPI0025400A82|nr:uncharacterized protein N7478_002057 [Penicillium angulare]KAJ5289027.1 hypothetical protein N7478_002057 [Penicillium angulare]